MDTDRRRLLIASGLVPLAAVYLPSVRAQQFSAGRHFSVLNPAQPVESENKIEVLEFFWYGCPHCYNLLPVMEGWQEKIATDVGLRRVPTIFNDRWALDATHFYALEALGVVGKLHRPLFDAIHRDRLRTDDPAAMRAWLEKNGVDPAKFAEASKSFGVQTQVRRALQLTRGYRIQGTPTLAVHGKYTISADQASNREEMVAIADQLVSETRKARAQGGK